MLKGSRGKKCWKIDEKGTANLVLHDLHAKIRHTVRIRGFGHIRTLQNVKHFGNGTASAIKHSIGSIREMGNFFTVAFEI